MSYRHGSKTVEAFILTQKAMLPSWFVQAIKDKRVVLVSSKYRNRHDVERKAFGWTLKEGGKYGVALIEDDYIVLEDGKITSVPQEAFEKKWRKIL